MVFSEYCSILLTHFFFYFFIVLQHLTAKLAIYFGKCYVIHNLINIKAQKLAAFNEKPRKPPCQSVSYRLWLQFPKLFFTTEIFIDETLEDTIRYVLVRRRLAEGNISKAQTVIITITERPQGKDINLFCCMTGKVGRNRLISCSLLMLSYDSPILLLFQLI